MFPELCLHKFYFHFLMHAASVINFCSMENFVCKIYSPQIWRSLICKLDTKVDSKNIAHFKISYACIDYLLTTSCISTERFLKLKSHTLTISLFISKKLWLYCIYTCHRRQCRHPVFETNLKIFWFPRGKIIRKGTASPRKLKMPL